MDRTGSLPTTSEMYEVGMTEDVTRRVVHSETFEAALRRSFQFYIMLSRLCKFGKIYFNAVLTTLNAVFTLARYNDTPPSDFFDFFWNRQVKCIIMKEKKKQILNPQREYERCARLIVASAASAASAHCNLYRWLAAVAAGR